MLIEIGMELVEGPMHVLKRFIKLILAFPVGKIVCTGHMVRMKDKK